MNSVYSPEASILIVDDNEANIRYLATLLDDEGYNVRAATSGEMAISAVSRMAPDLILLDVMMPNMDGYETLNRIKSISGAERIPVIFLTARTEESDIIRGFETGAVDYVKKPFNSMELLARIKTHLKLRQEDQNTERMASNQKYFLRLLTHDLAGNLSGMDSMALWASQDSSRGIELSTFIRKAVASSLELIQTVQKLTEMEMSRGFLSLAETSLGDAVQIAISNLNDIFRNKEIQVDLDLQYEGLIRAERVTLINTVLKNILHNATKFTTRGGHILIKSEKDTDTAILRIIDSGVGFPDELKDKVFRKDRISGHIGTENELGTGYGLFLTGKLVEAYGGSIFIQSPPDGATEVVIHFQIP